MMMLEGGSCKIILIFGCPHNRNHHHNHKCLAAFRIVHVWTDTYVNVVSKTTKTTTTTCGFCSAPWSRSSTQCRWSRCSTTLSRRWRNSCWTCLLLMISRFPSRVLKCPRSFEDIPSRRSCREPQLAEQLAEVPTILYLLKQTVYTPVPRRGGVDGFSLSPCARCSPLKSGQYFYESVCSS